MDDRNIFRLWMGQDDVDNASSSEEEYIPPPGQEESDSSAEEMSSDEELDRSFTQLEPPAGSSQGAQATISVTPHVLLGKDNSEWSTIPPVATKTPSRNVFRPPTNKVINCPATVSPGDAFRLFISSAMILNLVRYTNLEGRRVMDDGWKDVDDIEMEALLGCFLNLGAMGQGLLPTTLIWDRIMGNSFVRSVMGRYRFLELCKFLRFDDKASRSLRRERDIFAPFREIWDMFNQALKRHYVPGPYLTVDEQLVAWRGRCKFLQYLPSKPGKYGLKIFWVTDAETFYPLEGIPYLGKEGRDRQLFTGRNIATSLCSAFFNTGRNLTCDNFFTDLTLAEGLAKNGLSVVGTVRRNKRFLPKEIINPAIAKHESVFAFQKTTTLLSYKSGSKKNVILLSTMHHDKSIDDTPKKRPEMVTFYNNTKGGVDVMDKMAAAMSTRRVTQRWPMRLFFNMLDVAAIAAVVAFRHKMPGRAEADLNNRRGFHLAVAQDLVQEQVRRRTYQTNLPKEILGLATDLLARCEKESTGQEQAVASTSRSGTSTKRPVADPASTQGDPQAKPAKKKKQQQRCTECPRKKDRKTKNQCAACHTFVCLDHGSILCSDCYAANM